MSRRSAQGFATIRTEGGILSSGLLQRLAAQDHKGLTPESYHLGEGDTIKDAIARSWTRLLAVWRGFRQSLEREQDADPATRLTREKWLLLVFEELRFGRLQSSPKLTLDGRDYPISHQWNRVPIHLVGARVGLDRRTKGVVGAATSSPHGLVQDFLNRSDDHLWGIVSNGLTLRLLRDHLSLTRLAFVEFDIETMFDEEVYADFALLWLVCHQSRFEGECPEGFTIERWSREGADIGIRALDHLREGVQKAIETLGSGFLASPGNTDLKQSLRSGELDKQDYYRELLRLVYRLIFLFVAEDRGLLHPPDTSPEAAKRYRDHYSTQHLRDLAKTIRGSRHADRWRLFLHVSAILEERGSSPLGLPALGGFLWSCVAAPHLDASDIDNAHLLEAVRHLAFVTESKMSMPVDWKNLGAEELGSIYESLLELHPEIHGDAARFALKIAAGHERKTTGSYYTPASLIQCLLDSALEPVLDEAAQKTEPANAILALKVCDPACGSGHFLVAAAHRIARRLAAVRTGDEEPAPESYRTALRDVIGHCIYGVDLNPMAVELCKVSLWMEALDPGKPLSFLDHRIRCGNSLLGSTPALLAKGIPDEAFETIEGDDKVVARELKKRNKDARKGQSLMFGDIAADSAPIYTELSRAYAAMDALDDTQLRGVRAKIERHGAIEASPEYQRAKLVADAWCAAFVWRKTRDAAPAITQDVFVSLTRSPDPVPLATRVEVERLARQYGFFQWHLGFPDVFRCEKGRPENDASGWSGGFDIVLANPPWERIKLQQQEWFATRSPAIAAAANKSQRQRLIDDLLQKDPELLRAFNADIRQAEGESSLIRNSGRFPLCGRGDVNTYTVFAETMRSVLAARGRVGCIVPSGIATDDTTKVFFQDVIERKCLVSLFDFVNDAGLFPGVGHGRFKFALLTIGGSAATPRREAQFAFQVSEVVQLRDAERRFVLTAEDIALLNPNTRTCSVFRTGRDAEITKRIYRRVPVLIREGPPEENPWGMSFSRMLDMSTDSSEFRTRGELERDRWQLRGNVFVRGDEHYLPLYEAKMIHHFDHRYGDYADRPVGSENTSLPDVPVERLADPSYAPLPRYWVPKDEVEERLRGKWTQPFLLGWRDITNSTNERTVVASLLPSVASGDTVLLMFPQERNIQLHALLIGNLDAIILDYAARQKVGGTHLKYHVFKQLPVLPPATYQQTYPWTRGVALVEWLFPRAFELVYTAHDVDGFAHACGFTGAPFGWDVGRRFQLRCELDAAFFHLYGIPRDDVDHILGTFPIVRRNDEAKFGSYRTKHRILELYDEFAAVGGVPASIR
jgi:hypothetical protein